MTIPALESQKGVRSSPRLPLETRFGPIRLAVTDGGRALAIWRDVVGLELLGEDHGILRLGVGGCVLVELETGAERAVAPNTTGLYHVAIHLPARSDLAQLVLRALRQRVRIAPTDHLVSEAVYLWDHDGNGIEMTFETPWRGRLGEPEEGVYVRAADGRSHSGREPIDVDGLLAELGPNPELQPRLPAGSRIGHVHLHVRDLDEAMHFYRDGLGFGGLFLMRNWGMGDVGLDYMPHSLAFNIWAGLDAPPPPSGAAGLRWFVIRVPGAEAFVELRDRLNTAGYACDEVDNGLELRDPSGNLLRVVAA